MKEKLGFIGTGFMGSALLKGIIASGLVSPGNIYIYDADAQTAVRISKETGVIPVSNNRELVENAEVIILAVKPGIIKDVLDPIKVILKDKLLISVAAGIPIKAYKDILEGNCRIIRAMPNTPALVGEGMTLVCGEETISKRDMEIALEIFRSVGKAEVLQERLMNEVIALTGSSPAYVYMFIEAMADAAVQSGIPRNLAYRLASQAVLGSAKMVMETGKHPGELKDQVCSPAGTTIEAVNALEKNGFRHAIIEAMGECTRRAREISKSI